MTSYQIPILQLNNIILRKVEEMIIMKVFNIKTMLKWRNLVYFVIILIFIAVSMWRDIKISEDVLFWTFSTVVQAFMALIALLGMVGIYKLQVINNEIDKTVELIRMTVQYFRGLRAQGYSREEIIMHCNRISQEEHPGSSGELSIMQAVNKKFGNLLDKEKEIKKNVIYFATYTVFIVYLSLFFLSWTDNIIVNNLFSRFTLVIVIILSLFSLIMGLNLLRRIL